MGPGMGHPSLTLPQPDGSRLTIMLGPYPFLAEKNFQVAVGNQVSVLAFQSYWDEKTFVAIEVRNLTTGSSLTLRQADGTPLWAGAGYGWGCGMGGYGGYGMGPGPRGCCRF